MNLNKRKIITSDISDEDENFKHRRSSLRVNLSYSSNLTDSGNGSLWRTKIENNERETNKTQVKRRLLRSKNTYEKQDDLPFDFNNKGLHAISDVSKHAVNNDSKMFVQVKEELQLKDLTIYLEDISTKEQALETKCKSFKDAILNKTKEVFHRENELSIKTAMVLQNEENRLVCNVQDSNTEKPNFIYLNTTDHCITNKYVECEQYTDIESNKQRENQYSNIVTTPTNSDRQRNSERIIDKSRLIKKQLYIKKNKPVEGQAKCRIIEDVVLKKNFALLPLRRTDQSNSPILSGSNRRLSLLKSQPKLYSQDQSKSYNNTCSTIHSIQSTNIEEPIVCSTFIQDNAMNEKENKSIYNEINNDIDISSATRTINKVISMEITDVHDNIRISENVTNNQNVADTCVDTVIPMQTSNEEIAITTKIHDVQTRECDNKIKNQNMGQCTLFNSSNITQSSLNVNTSLDVEGELSKVRNVRKLSNFKTIDTNQNFETNNEKPIALDDQHESVDTNRTSLQVNISADSVCKIWGKRNNHLNKKSLAENMNDKDLMGNHSSIDNQHLAINENKKVDDINSLENISLIERLKNISMQKSLSHNNNSRVSEIKNQTKARDVEANSLISGKYQNNECMNNSGDNYIKVTPISRSVYSISQLKYKAQNMDKSVTPCSNKNSINNEEDNDRKSNILHQKIPNEMCVSNETDTVILENTLSGNPFVTQDQLITIQDTFNKINIEINEKNITASQNMEYVPKSRKGRRKLMTLVDNSQLHSFTPMEEKRCITEESTPIQRNKKVKKNRPTKKIADIKNDTSKCNTSEQMWSDIDFDVLKNKKIEDKKMRKPRKVISKKIVIKKFVHENIFNILEENRQNEEGGSMENRDSLDDFAKRRAIPIHWNKYKSQKIIIVTTGLSKGDKSLVKNIVRSLGKADMELNVTRRTTHVVSTGLRTVNLLRGIIRGCWLITLDWVLKSLENNAWLDPEKFEMQHFSKAVQENRKDRQLFGPSYIPELFATCGFIYVEHKTTVPQDTLKELIKTAGGHITENIKLAKIIIGRSGLKETWVIDSITTGELQSTKIYKKNEVNK